MKKFLPKRKTERKPSDEEFVIRKSKCWGFFSLLFGGLCVLGDLRGTLRAAFLTARDAPGCLCCEQAYTLPSAGGFWKCPAPQPLSHPLPVTTARSPATLLVILWLWVVLFWLRSQGATSKGLKAASKLHINGHQNVSESWDKPLAGCASSSWSSFRGGPGNKKGPHPCRECSPAKRDVLTAP